MFRQPDNFVFQWTIPKKPSKDFWVELRKLDARVLRLPLIGLTIGFGTFVVVKLIVPTIELPWLTGIEFALVTMLLLGLFFFALIFDTVQFRYGITSKIVSQLGTDGLQFSRCMACAVAPLETHCELISRTGHVLRIELPEDEALRAQILEYVQARVKPWAHAELPSAMLAQALVLDEYLILPYWVMTFFGNLLLAYWVSLYIPVNDDFSAVFYFSYFFWEQAGFGRGRAGQSCGTFRCVSELIWYSA